MWLSLLQFRWLSSPAEWFFLIADVLIVAFIVVNIVDINRFVVRKTVLSSEKIPEGEEIRFVFLTDLHSRKYAGNNEKLLREIRACNPDFILCGGDMMTAKEGKNNEPAVSFMNRLAEDYKIYYAFGNHEFRAREYKESYGSMYEDYRKAVRSDNIIWLDNESVAVVLKKDKSALRIINERMIRSEEDPEITVNSEYNPEDNSKRDIRIYISGLSIEKVYYKRLVKQKLPEGYVAKTVGPRREDIYQILLAHNPQYADDYFAYGADLFLSGHYHGGVIRLPFIGGVASPAIRLFPKYSGGLYHKNDKYGYVSCGLGTHTVPMRFLNPGEVSYFEIKHK